MPLFLIDVNLPYHFEIWGGKNFIHLKDIDDTWPDNRVWEYSRQNNLTIISKDADFSARMMMTEPPPRVIHMRIGNMRLTELHEFIKKNWSAIIEMNGAHKLVNVFRDRIEGI